MRGKTINPNPPICRSKEPSFTYINIYSCTTKQIIKRIQHYDWNLTQAKAAADGGVGTFTEGYFYEAAFSKYTDLDRKDCPIIRWIGVSPDGIVPGNLILKAYYWDGTSAQQYRQLGQGLTSPFVYPGFPDQELIEIITQPHDTGGDITFHPKWTSKKNVEWNFPMRMTKISGTSPILPNVQYWIELDAVP